MEQQYINMALSVSFLVLGWFAREMWTAVKDLKTDLSKLREELPKDYVSKDDYRQDVKELKDMIGKLFDLMEKRR